MLYSTVCASVLKYMIINMNTYIISSYPNTTNKCKISRIDKTTILIQYTELKYFYVIIHHIMHHTIHFTLTHSAFPSLPEQMFFDD